MGGRGGSGRSSAAVIQVPAVDAKALADMDLRDAYEDVANITNAASRNQNQGPWVTIQRLRTALSTRGWDREKQDREITRFVREGKAVAAPESNQKLMTPEFRRSAIQLGNEDKHIISFF
jgi:hypothetical protein